MLQEIHIEDLLPQLTIFKFFLIVGIAWFCYVLTQHLCTYQKMKEAYVGAIKWLYIAGMITFIISLAYNWILIGGFGLAISVLTIKDIFSEYSSTYGAPQQYNYQDEIVELEQPQVLLYQGEDLKFSTEDLDAVLIKRFPYYVQLSKEQKEIFIVRLKKFITAKQFYIHDKSGFREMPILICASAITLSFGWKKFLLPSIQEIHVYPDAFIQAYPFLRVLEGNVTGPTLNLSWKHFLDGYTIPDNGQNVGLHEFAHAYQYELCSSPSMIDFDFVEKFNDFRVLANDAILTEKCRPDKLYSDYGLQNIDEFWAESIELFFEKKIELHQQFPNLFQTMQQLLNQYSAY